MLIIFTACWIVSSVVSLIMWLITARRGHEWIATQQRRGENGVLRLIALQKWRLATTALAIAAVMLSVVVVSLLLPQPYRMYYGRVSLTAVAVLFALMAWQFEQYSDRIMRGIRRDYSDALAVKDGEL